jgi:hypothetical protein
VTVHDLPGPRLVALQASCVVVNAAEPDSAIVSAPEAVPPELLSVNSCDTLSPGCTVP